MFNLALGLIAAFTAMTCIQQIIHLDRLAHEFRRLAERTEGAPTDIFRAMMEAPDLDRSQRLLRTEALATSSLLILSLSCLLGVILISW